MDWSARTEDEASLQEGLPADHRLLVASSGESVTVETPLRPPGTWRLREVSLFLSFVVLFGVTLFWVIFMIWSSWFMVVYGLVFAAFAFASAHALAERALYRQRVTCSPDQLTIETLFLGHVLQKTTGGPVQFVETTARSGPGEVHVFNEKGEFVVGSFLSHAERTWLTDLLELARVAGRGDGEAL